MTEITFYLFSAVLYILVLLKTMDDNSNIIIKVKAEMTMHHLMFRIENLQSHIPIRLYICLIGSKKCETTTKQGNNNNKTQK
jgi:hypothetical protein